MSQKKKKKKKKSQTAIRIAYIILLYHFFLVVSPFWLCHFGYITNLSPLLILYFINVTLSPLLMLL